MSNELYNIKAFLGALLLACTLGIAPSTSKAAETLATSYITPFPDGGKYNILVIGDGFAANASAGLSAAFKDNKKIVIHRDISYGARLKGKRRSDWPARIDKILAKKKFDIVVIMLGLADRRSVKIARKVHKIGSVTWRTVYRQGVSEMLKKLAAKNIAIYWVGMPIVRGPNTRNDLQIINEAVRIQTYNARAKYIDNWLHFANEDGQYSPYGPDLSGKIGLLRSKEGLYFTRKGSVKLGHFIKNYIQRDLIEARAERDIPLFGTKKEQTYLLQKSLLNNTKGVRARAKIKLNTAKLNAARRNVKYPVNTLQPGEFESAKHSEITLDGTKTRTGKPRKIKLLRPAIPAAAFSATRRSRLSTGGGLPNGNILLEPLSELTGLAITSSGQNLISDGGQRRLPLTQTPYYKLLIRGDAQGSKPGRADNFIWPLSPRLEFGQNMRTLKKNP